MKKVVFKNMDDYIALFPEEVQNKLTEIREAIRSVAPDAEEVISYQMPAFRQNGVLVYFAAYKNHIGFYPTSSGIKAFQNELSAYAGSKGTVRFDLDKPIPLGLIKKIVKFRMKEDLNKMKNKKT